LDTMLYWGVSQCRAHLMHAPALSLFPALIYLPDKVIEHCTSKPAEDPR
jgi:hypothetical protein